MLWISRHFRIGTYRYQVTHGLAIGWLRIGWKIKAEKLEKKAVTLGFDRAIWFFFVLATISLW